MKLPKTLWIVSDEPDDPHVFTSKREAKEQVNAWRWGDRGRGGDSDIGDPVEYVRKEKP